MDHEISVVYYSSFSDIDYEWTIMIRAGPTHEKIDCATHLQEAKKSNVTHGKGETLRCLEGRRADAIKWKRLTEG